MFARKERADCLEFLAMVPGQVACRKHDLELRVEREEGLQEVLFRPEELLIAQPFRKVVARQEHSKNTSWACTSTPGLRDGMSVHGRHDEVVSRAVETVRLDESFARP